MKRLFKHKRAILAFTLAFVLALPMLFEQTGQLGPIAGLICVLNLPGMLLGLVNGRFFPPEGYIGQSPIRFVGMLIVQSVLWYLVICLLGLVSAGIRKKNRDHATPRP